MSSDFRARRRRGDGILRSIRSGLPPGLARRHTARQGQGNRGGGRVRANVRAGLSRRRSGSLRVAVPMASRSRRLGATCLVTPCRRCDIPRCRATRNSGRRNPRTHSPCRKSKGSEAKRPRNPAFRRRGSPRPGTPFRMTHNRRDVHAKSSRPDFPPRPPACPSVHSYERCSAATERAQGRSGFPVGVRRVCSTRRSTRGTL